MQVLNDPWPWRETLRGHPLTISDLVSRGTLTPEVAATLWWAMMHGASVFVAAGPPGAGKSTVANALLEYLPDDAQVYVTSGAWDRMEIPPSHGPVYLLINELSAHMPVYLYGPAARRAFDLVQEGTRMVGTLHAWSAAEALRVMCYEARLEPSAITAPFVFAAIAAYRSGQQIVRRVVEVGFVPPCGEMVALARTTSDAPDLDGTGLQSLADWSGVSAKQFRAQIAGHAAQLRV